MEFNYAEMLSLDRAVSIVSGRATIGRKLTNWENKIAQTNYPFNLEIEFIDTNEFASLGIVSSVDGLLYRSEDGLHELSVTFDENTGIADGVILESVDGTEREILFDRDTFTEGELTLQDGAKIFLYDPAIHKEDKTVSVVFDGISRASLSDELTDWIHARLGIIEDQTIKGHSLEGKWRLIGISTQDTDSKSKQGDAVTLSLVYKKGCATQINHEEGRLVNKASFKSNSSVLFVKFPNIDPLYLESAEAAYSSYLVSGTIMENPEFGGKIYAGEWRLVKVESSENKEDGSGEITFVLVKPGNEDFYATWMAGHNVRKAIFLKYDTTEEIVQDFISTAGFTADGEYDPDGAVGYKLSDNISGRTVVIERAIRDPEDRLFDLYIEITWTSAQFLKDESTSVATPDAALTQEASGSGGKITPRFGSVFLKRWTELGVRTEKLPVDVSGTIAGSYDTEDGLFVHETTISGLSGPAIEVDEQGRYSWRVNHVLASVKDALWHVWAVGREWRKREDSKAGSWQQVRRRIGGELEYRKDDQGNLIGVRWDNAFDIDRNYGDTTAPAAWISNGWQAKYGDWKTNWEKSFIANHPVGNTDMGVGNDAANYVGTSGHVFVAAVPLAATTITYGVTKNVWYAQDTGNFYVAKSTWTTSAYALSNATYFDVVTKANVRTACPGMPGYIGLRGVGAYPLEDVDKYIPILQELEREVRWDNDFDIDRNYGDTTAPAAWASEGYDDLYGPWYPGWEKRFIENFTGGNKDTGVDNDAAQYIGTSGHIFVASLPLAATNINYAQLKNVWYAQDTGNFYVCILANGGTPRLLTNTTYFTVVTKANVRTACPGMPGYIAQRGVGTYPQEEVAKVGVITADGGYALSASARVTFGSNPHENPEYFEAGQRLKRREDVVIFRTFYAINPVFVTNSRIPQSIENLDQNLLTVATPTGEKIFHKDDPNLSAEFRTIQLGEYLWCHELVLSRKGEYLADEPVQSSDPEDGATDGLMNGATRNYPATDANGFWGIYHRIPETGSFTGAADVTGKPAGAYKDA